MPGIRRLLLLWVRCFRSLAGTPGVPVKRGSIRMNPSREHGKTPAWALLKTVVLKSGRGAVTGLLAAGAAGPERRW
jgi:hypothetical protein